MNQRLLFPPTEYKVQSPYLYLQAVGSTGVDGSTYGAHLRWQLLRNLGNTHLAKGNNATTTINFNRPDDFLTLLRSRYVTRFPTIVDFSVAPHVVNDALAFWIYTATNTSTVIYIHFGDAERYALVRSTVDPSAEPQNFVQQYCPGLIEVEAKDKLFFAAEFDVVRDAATVMRAEALSLEENVPLSPLFVSCRKVFTDDNWCASPDGPQPAGVPACCDGPNLLENGDFERRPGDAFFTENFDGVIAPALPAGWVATNVAGPDPKWVTSATNPDTAPNDAFVDAPTPVVEAPASVADHCLDTADITITSPSPQLSFRNNFDMEFSGGKYLNGGVLEVTAPNINGGAFTDVFDATVGASFVSGGYTGVISDEGGNPLASRDAWCGNSGGYIDTVMNLGPNLNGQTIKLRFRMGTGEAGGAARWRIDTLSIAGKGAPFTENFDGVTPPALPAGWVATNPMGPDVRWITSATNPDTPPNAACVEAPAPLTDKCLDTRDITITSSSPRLSFRNNFDMEFSGGIYLNGGVLEVTSPNINGGAFTDVTDPAVGGSFVSGEYTGTISNEGGNPLADRMAWSGNSGGYIDTVMDLGPNLNGQTIKLRFRMGTGEAAGAARWRIDTLSIAGEGGPFELGFETDYILQGGAKAGTINVTEDASSVNGQWVGLPHTGRQFLAVDGSVTKGSAVLRFTRPVDSNTDYCFTGWLATLWKEDVSIPLQFRFTSADGTVQLFEQSTPATVGEWEEFTFSWNSGVSLTATVEIISLSTLSVGNDFGIDDLWFCKGRECRARIGSENIRSVRFDVNGGYPRRLELETYDAYITGALWDTLDRLALTTTPTQGLDGMVLEISINGGPFTDILAAGGSFITGGYTHSISAAFGSPIAGRMAWSGLSGGPPTAPTYITTKVNLPPAAHGQSIRLKWRVATDNSGDVATGVRGVRIDNIAIAPGPFSQRFDGITAPGLPAGWTTAATGAATAWVTSTTTPASAPNAAFAPDVNGIGDAELVTPAIALPAGGGILTFKNLFNLAFNTVVDNTAFGRLEPAPNTVNGHWQKFNDNALLNVFNYQDRWTRAGGLGYGVQRYIELSNTDPMANEMLLGDTQPQDGSIKFSFLDALRMVAFDFHVARMLGLGYLDRDIAQDTDEYIYLGVYDTHGALDDTNIARVVRHHYMGVPTKPLDHRLPDSPTLKPVTYGLTVDSGEPQPASLTDPKGYTPDGLSRYVNLFVEPEDESEEPAPFFVPPLEFCSTDRTSSVFYGIEYRSQGESAWRKPEIPCDATYKDLDVPCQFETLPLPNNFDPAKPNRPILRHEEREDGVHEYGGYGINWFSRASSVGNIVATDATLITKAQRLLPPANLAVQLIQKESPLMLTTQNEQVMLAALSGPDRTLVRVTFDYFHVHDINYGFAKTVELFFRRDMPRNVVGAVKSVSDDPLDRRKAIIRTTGYIVNSQGTTITPALDPALFGNFVGGMFSCQQQNYIVTDVSPSTQAGEGPTFTVQKNVQGNAADPGPTGAYLTVQEYTAPNLRFAAGQVMFMAVENMADPDSWGTPPNPLNPLSRVVNLGDSTWTTHTETYVQDGDTITVKLRGVLAPATVSHTPTPEAPGVYQITFDTYQLPHHQQNGETDPVEWYKGAVRLARAGDPNGPKKVLEVLLIDHLGENQPLVLHVLDNEYDPNDPGDLVVTGPSVKVNYYPGYKVYLHADPSRNFTEAAILPAEGEGTRKTWLGARSVDTPPYQSPVGIPTPVIALEFVEPSRPKEPDGGEFATWPDFYYKASYTFKLDFAAGHKPFSVVLYRTNDEAILRTLYSNDTYNAVRRQLGLLGDNDPYLSDRWKNLVSFNYDYGDPLTDGTFRKFPDGYGFPNPDKSDGPNGRPGAILPALKEAIRGAFTPLTEMPLLFDLIKEPPYEPVPKPQNIRNEQGTLLDPNDPKFDIAPMAKRTGNGFEIQFTDFTLDGTSNNIFFYCGCEIGNLGSMGEPGPIAGPVQLINTRPPDQPGVKKMYVKELDLLNNTGPAVTFEVNAYPDVQKIRRMLVYRATAAADALSVRAMQLVKTVDLVATNQIGQPSVLLSDDFESGFVPYGDPLFYRLVALRQVKNPHGGTDWAPSQPSKVLLTAVPDTINPEAPEITFTSNGLSGSPATLTGVNLSWPTTVYNGTYYLDKINAVGNWVTIYRIKTNTTPITVNLAATDLGTDVLPKEDADEGQPIYHRFRVRVENSSGLFSLIDKVLVI